jgi:hypothetical protein
MTTTTTMPEWLKTMLIDQGRLSETGLTRRARIRTHKPCHLPTLAGYDADTCALDTWCDLAELTLAGEVHALLAGRTTYELTTERLYRRDRWTITGRPAGRMTPVFAEHRCHAPIPATWAVPPLPAQPAPPATPSSQEAPF